MSEAATDLLGNPLTDGERRLLAIYEQLVALREEDDLAPAVRANVAEALAALWQAVNDLALTHDRPDV
jgi:hypothetical protein